jgi:general stress protein 26
MLTAEQKQKLAALFAREHVAVLITQGEQWTTGTMQAFAETDALELLFIMGADAEKYQNALKRPNVTVMVDTRDQGKVETFDITRGSIQGVATEVPRDSAEWESLKTIFLKKNPFEAPFFGNPGLRMMKVIPKRVSYASGLKDTFKAEF